MTNPLEYEMFLFWNDAYLKMKNIFRQANFVGSLRGLSIRINAVFYYFNEKVKNISKQYFTFINL